MSDGHGVREAAGGPASATDEHSHLSWAGQEQPRTPSEGESRWLAKEEEQALLSRAKAGDDVAYAVLVRHNADPLYAVVLRFSATEAEAQDATQDAFLRAWQSIGGIRGDGRFFSWLYRFGVSEAKRIRERRAAPGRPDAVADGTIGRLQDDAPDVEPQPHPVERREVIEQAIRALPEKYRAALVLRDIAGLPAAEASEALGLREAAFKRRLHRARMTLHANLGPQLWRESSDGAPQA
jgi:RNA polymerase sigma-70 factor (ECF subfamily)